MNKKTAEILGTHNGERSLEEFNAYRIHQNKGDKGKSESNLLDKFDQTDEQVPQRQRGVKKKASTVKKYKRWEAVENHDYLCLKRTPERTLRLKERIAFKSFYGINNIFLNLNMLIMFFEQNRNLV